MLEKSRRLLAATLVPAAFAGCTAAKLSLDTPPETHLDESYTAEVTITAVIFPPSAEDTPVETEFTMSGNLCRLGSGFWKLETASPADLEGLCFSMTDSTLNISLDELSMTADCTDIPDSSPVVSLFTLLDSAALTAAGLTECEGEEKLWQFDGSAGGCGYTVTVDDCGCPVKLECESKRLVCTFEDFAPADSGNIHEGSDVSETTVTAAAGSASPSEETTAAETEATSAAKNGCTAESTD